MKQTLLQSWSFFIFLELTLAMHNTLFQKQNLKIHLCILILYQNKIQTDCIEKNLNVYYLLTFQIFLHETNLYQYY